jgi:hypothetical protein
MKYICFYFILFILFSCKKEIDPSNVIEISKVVTNTAPYKGVIVAQRTSSPEMIYVDAKCNLYVVEAFFLGPRSRRDRVIKYKSGSKQGEIVAGSDSSLARIRGVYVDKNDVLYVTATTSSISKKSGIFKFLPGHITGQCVFDITASGFDYVIWDGKTDSKGNFYVVLGYPNIGSVIKWVPGTEKPVIVAVAETVDTLVVQIDTFLAIDLDAEGNLYIDEWGNLRIQKWESGASTGTTIVSTDQLTAQPLGVAVDENHNVYVNEGGYRILKFAPGAKKGQVIIDQTSPGAPVDFVPGYIYSDKRGSLYICDANHPDVSKWTQK